MIKNKKKHIMSIPHLNLSSYPGGGKTTLTKLMINTYSCLLIPKFTTRPPRPIEDIPEYIFIKEDEFLYKKNAGHFITIEPINIYGEIHYSAIPKIEHWPKPDKNTKFVLSTFGENAPYAKQFIPKMKLIFIDFKNKDILMERLYLRCLLDNSGFEEKKKIIEQYIQKDIKRNYDHIIYNDGSIEESLEQILNLVQVPQNITT
jgi:guanylate kinase